MTAADTRLGLLLDEYLDRLNRGETPDPDEYASRFPDLADTFRRLATALAILPAATRSPTVPGFEVVREIGRGGMGVVFEAVELALGRRVALKTLPAQMVARPQALDRFRREAKAAARLHHPHIVPVFGVGEQSGVHYYAMQFVDGQTLAAALARRDGVPDAAGVRAAAHVAEQLADALAYAHSQGVLHRDVKPGNVLLADGPDGEPVPYLADFGLAKLVGDDDLTGTGDFIGTPRYAAPEQLRNQFDARGDVYGLGVTLYELLTDRPALDAPDREGLLRQLAGGDPPRPRSLNPAVPRDLETVVLKAIAKEPGQRYPSAAAFAADLARWQAGEPVSARRVGPVGRAWRWSRRNPAVGGLLAAVGGLLLTVAVTAAVGYIRTSAALETSETNRKAAEAAQLAEQSERVRAVEKERETRRAFEQVVAAVHKANDITDSIQPISLRSIKLMVTTGVSVPGPNTWVMADLIYGMLTQLTAMYERFLAITFADPEWELEQAGACRRLAVLRAELGDLDAAERWHREAVARATTSTDDRWRHEAALARAGYGLFLHAARKQPVSNPEYAAGMAELRKLAAEHPTVAEYPSEHGLFQYRLALQLPVGPQRAGVTGSALVWQKKALAIADSPTVRTRLRDTYYIWVASLQKDDPVAARKAVDEWADLFPQSAEHLFVVAHYTSYLTRQPLLSTPKPDSAITALWADKTAEIFRRWFNAGGRGVENLTPLPRVPPFDTHPEFRKLIEDLKTAGPRSTAATARPSPLRPG